MSCEINASINFQADSSVAVEVTTNKTTVTHENFPSYDELVKEIGIRRFWYKVNQFIGGGVVVMGVGSEIIKFGRLVVERGVHQPVIEHAMNDQIATIALTLVGLMWFNMHYGFNRELDVVEREQKRIAERIPDSTRIVTL